MKIKFKEQQFQIDAVQSVVDCFRGQPNQVSHFQLDRGMAKGEIAGQQMLLLESGFKNNPIMLSEEEVLENIRKVQLRNGLKPSASLAGRYNLTIEMETGARVIIVTGCINVLISRVSETFIKNKSCIT
jgi:type III restriction enzyme